MIELVIHARPRSLGGFEVGRVLPWSGRRMVGPFIFFDHMGPVHLPAGLPRSADVRPHPHVGLATVTYLFAGEITHRDSLGFEQAIRPLEVNWMTAGRGITHSERFEALRAHGGLLHGIQAWVALPEADEDTAPSFVHVAAAALPVADLDGAQWRIIAGSMFGLTSPVQTRSPLFYVHGTLRAGAVFTLSAGYEERAVFVASGAVEVAGARYDTGQMLVIQRASTPQITALGATDLMLLGGQPLGVRHIWWNFVATRPARIEQAKAAWRAGEFALPSADADEFIPLPDDPAPRAEPMS